MKQKTLQIAAALFAALGFAPQAFADTDILTAEQGYQKIKNMPENLGDYYFIIVDKDKDLMMTQGAAEKQRSNDYASYNYKAAWYMPSADPATDLSRVWTVEANNHDGATGYGLRGALRPSHLMQPEGVSGAWAFRTKDIMTTPNEWAQYLLAYNEKGEYWTIQNARYTNDGYVGPWDNVIEAGAEMAGNKQDAAMGRFVFYAITKGNFYLAKIAISMIPVGIVGVFFKDYVEAFFGNGLLLVGIMLLVTAVLLTFAYYARPRVKEEISYRDAFIIGLSQAVAVLPGLSRSGTTIATGLMLGNKKEQVARFSFLMVIIPILGETCLELMKGGFSPAESGLSLPVMIVGFLAAFVSGCLACKWMLRLVNNGKLVYFAIYCVAMGAFAIIYSLVH